MGMNMTGEHCPNCGDDLDEGQIGLCEECSFENDNGTHGSPELDADARKLEAMGQDAGPTITELFGAEVPSFTADWSTPEDKLAISTLTAMRDKNIQDLELATRVAAMLVIAIGDVAAQLVANQEAWEGEEDTVKEEHSDLMAENARLIIACAAFAKAVPDGK